MVDWRVEKKAVMWGLWKADEMAGLKAAPMAVQ
jgi:hypothetical protein